MKTVQQCPWILVLVCSILFASIFMMHLRFMGESISDVSISEQAKKRMDFFKSQYALSVVCDHSSFDIIRNGSILSNGEVLKDNGQFIDISGGCCKPENPRPSKIRLSELEPGPLGVLLHSHDGTYYHAMYEFGSRLHFVMDRCPCSDVEWIIRGSPAQRKILALLDPGRRLRVAAFATPRRAASILIPPAPTRPVDADAFHSAVIARAHRLSRALPPSPRSQGAAAAGRRVLYVERLRRRAVLNAEELLAAVLDSSPGELATSPDDGLPLHAAVAAFDGAALVVGGHGAGLTNIIFCRAGTHVIEILRRGQAG
jgi:hypothetical protein